MTPCTFTPGARAPEVAPTRTTRSGFVPVVGGVFAAFVGDLSGESVHERLSDPPLQVSVQRMVPDGRRGPGRPAIGGRVSVNLGDDLLAELDRIAQVQGMERSELIRQLLDAALARL